MPWSPARKRQGFCLYFRAILKSQRQNHKSKNLLLPIVHKSITLISQNTPQASFFLNNSNDVPVYMVLILLIKIKLVIIGIYFA